MSIFNRFKEVVRTIKFTASPRLYGRTSTGAGEGQEITVGTGLTLSAGSLTVNFGAVAAASHTHTAAQITDLVTSVVRYDQNQNLPPLSRDVALGNILPLSFSAPYTAFLRPTGANNNIGLSSTNPAITEATMVVVSEGTLERVDLSLSLFLDTLTIAAGDKYNLRVTADFGEGVITLLFTYNTPSSSWQATYNGYTWTVAVSDFTWYITSTDVGWTPIGAVTEGAPWPDEDSWPSGVTVTAHPATANQAIVGLNMLSGITATNESGNDGSGFLAPATAAFSGVPNLPPSGTFETADNKLITVTTGIITSIATI